MKILCYKLQLYTRGQFHKHFTHEYFVLTLCWQLFSCYMYIERAAETTFVQKICKYNIDEIDTRAPGPGVYFTNFCAPREKSPAQGVRQKIRSSILLTIDSLNFRLKSLENSPNLCAVRHFPFDKKSLSISSCLRKKVGQKCW